MQYEFRGRTLQQAVSKALTTNQKHNLCNKEDAGEQFSCRQLARWIDQLNSDVGDLGIKAEFLQARLERLRSSRRDNLTTAAITAATAAAGAIGSAVRAARTARRLLRGGGLRLNDVLSVIPYIGSAIVAARSALGAVQDSREIREALNQVNQLERMKDAIEGTVRELLRKWDQNRCDRFYS